MDTERYIKEGSASGGIGPYSYNETQQKELIEEWNTNEGHSIKEDVKWKTIDGGSIAGVSATDEYLTVDFGAQVALFLVGAGLNIGFRVE